MEKQPGFIREFSKEKSQAERDKVATEIRAKRNENFAVKREISEMEKNLQEKLTDIENLNNQISDLSQGGLSRLSNYFKLRSLRSQLQGEQNSVALVTAQKEGLLTPDSEEPRRMIEKFYTEQEKKWAESEYSKEDIQKYFSEEHLASLSVEEYALLMKRFPNQMVAHVTRQGIRDHTGMIYHTAGEGAYSDGFMKIVEDGRLRSPLGIKLVEDEKEKAIVGCFLEDVHTREEAHDRLKAFTRENQHEHSSSVGEYVDSMAVHFATEEVADCYYGSEKGNEIFIAYPSNHIASQYYFNGQLNKGGGGYWNDQWVWANEEKGMDINAGLVFIPAETMIGGTTGSRYELDEQKNPIKNREYQDTIKRVIDAADFETFASETIPLVGKCDGDYIPYEIAEKLKPYRQKLEKEFGITDSRLQSVILNYHNLYSLVEAKRKRIEGIEQPWASLESKIDDALQANGILFCEARDQVSSKDYWETYFAQKPDKKPSKIVYYKGIDPTRALWDWKKKEGLTKASDNKDMGFPDHLIRRDDSHATAGMDRFKALAENIINNYFDNLEKNKTREISSEV